MKVILTVLNALPVAAGVTLFALGLVYGRPGDWGTADAVKILLFLTPFLAALFALRGRSSFIRLFAAWCNAAWAVLLAVLGLGALTGIGGFIGLLIVIVPALLVLSLNWFVLLTAKGARIEI